MLGCVAAEVGLRRLPALPPGKLPQSLEEVALVGVGRGSAGEQLVVERLVEQSGDRLGRVGDRLEQVVGGRTVAQCVEVFLLDSVAERAGEQEPHAVVHAVAARVGQGGQQSHSAGPLVLERWLVEVLAQRSANRRRQYRRIKSGGGRVQRRRVTAQGFGGEPSDQVVAVGTARHELRQPRGEWGGVPVHRPCRPGRPGAVQAGLGE